MIEFRRQLVARLPWSGAVFAGVYTALYTRFASQWEYLATLYNQIKQTECSGLSNEVAFLEWKVAFIEDAEDLHLACKPSFAAVIVSWLRDDQVVKRYTEDVDRGPERLARLRHELDRALPTAKNSRSLVSDGDGLKEAKASPQPAPKNTSGPRTP